VTGGVKTPTTPMRGLEQLLCAVGLKLTIPARVGFTSSFTTPRRFDAFVRTSSAGPLTRTRTPATAFPCWEMRIVRTACRPTKTDRGETTTAVQNCTGGTSAPLTWTVADAVLFAGFVSDSLPVTVAVFVIEPTVVAVVRIVTVALAPAASPPSWQVTSGLPEHVPCVAELETNVIPAGTGSASVTPLAALGPLFVTTIVHVTCRPSDTGFGAALFVTARSIVGGVAGAGAGDPPDGAGGAGGGGGGGGGGGVTTVLLRFSQIPSEAL